MRRILMRGEGGGKGLGCMVSKVKWEGRGKKRETAPHAPMRAHKTHIIIQIPVSLGWGRKAGWVLRWEKGGWEGGEKREGG